MIFLKNASYNLIENVAKNALAGDSGDEDDEPENVFNGDISYKYESSECSSSSDEDESHRLSPIPDDANSTYSPAHTTNLCHSQLIRSR